MYFPATRLLTVLDLLRAHDSLSGPELAARLEVNVRSVRRYVTMLQDLGLPVESAPGPHGGYRLPPEFRARADYGRRPIWFSAEEALALALGMAYARRHAEGDLPPAAERAVAKLEQLLPPALREQMLGLDEALVLPPAPQEPRPAVPAAIVSALSAAVNARQRVVLHYRSFAGRESQRAVDPYGLVRLEGYWYLAAFCHQRQAPAAFRLDRVLAAAPLAQSFESPAAFDALQFVEAALARTPQRWHAEVLLGVGLEAARSRLPASLAMLEPGAEGVIMRCWVDDLDRLAHFLAGLPWPCRVLGPDALRQALASLAQRADEIAQAP
jgi:predicted DNA-binding transcriptional regulator YafY